MGDRQSSPARDGPHYFNNAHNFVVQNPTFVNMAPKSVLKWLGKRVMPGAEFDSSERDPPPRCHPGTRISINPNRSKNLLWLHGLAGVGKSAIIQSLAESESKSNGINDPNRLAAYVVELMTRDPRSLDKAMSEQFRKLFIEPFTQRGIGGGSTPWLILLDGLDECRPPGAESQAQSPSERTQCEIIKLISTFVLEYPDVPLLWIISSRPESHLMACFSSADIRAAYLEEDVPIDSNEACRDVERYLRSEFEKIRQQYPYHMPTASPWPREERVAVIARSARGHFVFAATVMKFIEDPDIGDPITQLEQILIFVNPQDPRHLRSVEGNPLAALDALYTSILQQINPETLPLTKRLLGYYVSVDHRPTYHRLLTVACNILNIEQNRAYSALRKLYAVLHIPHPTDAGERPLKFLHKSFVDYLENEDLSHNFSLNEADTEVGPWLCSTRVLEQAVVPHEPTPDISKISLCWCPVEKSAQIQLQWKVYAAASHLFGSLDGRVEDEVILDKIQSIDFSTIIGGHFIYRISGWICVNLLNRLTHSSSAYFTSHGLTRSISLGDVDLRHIRNDRLAYYGSNSLGLSRRDPRTNASSSIICHQDAAHVLQVYRYDPVRFPLSIQLFSLYVGVLPLKCLLDRLRLRQEQHPWAQATIIGASPSTSCIVFRCNYTPDGKLVNQDSLFPVLHPEGTRITWEFFVLPYLW
ncbi:hypothetical protein P691DRAFT_813428 [Macrolepiota fuliginosa MF-IS2]|uniref:NACHT domain-containing protein n=1 Tax=Macrolepiota fuliginosa MF-IS2 TaxID=1400762 RepID=A0A9P5X0H3_9AGAR|nr:hypothetical protein P691DRAFT_813428 [Macrolepiota fuliginosa MF-IS2]